MKSKKAVCGSIVRVFVVVLALSVAWGCAKQAKSPAEKVYLHKVESGETLSEIAEDYYGNASRGAVIGEFNAVDDDALKPGMVIRVPMTQEDIDRLTTREGARAPYNEGLELAKNGSYVDAVERFQEALEIDPDFVDAEYNLGVTLKMLKSYPKAIRHLDRAVELRPDNSEYLFALGNCLFHIDRFEDAADAFLHLEEGLDPPLVDDEVGRIPVARPERLRGTHAAPQVAEGRAAEALFTAGHEQDGAARLH